MEKKDATPKTEVLPPPPDIPTAPSKGGEALSNTHCPYQQASLLQQALSPDKIRVAFFLGAGCPVSIRMPEGGGTRPLIPDIKGLTLKVLSLLGEDPKYKDHLAAIVARLKDRGTESPNIETVLSHTRALYEVVGKSQPDGLTAGALSDLDIEICRRTTEVVRVELPDKITPYHSLATWIRGIQRAYAVEVFTPNYDLLFEQALEEREVPYFDGFVGSRRTFFDLASMEQDRLPPRWARLWKVHGSINWWRTPKGDIQRHDDRGEGDIQMIYPSHMKYDQSRRMPYLAMLDRLKTFLSHDQAILVTCGFSFMDQHLNETIFQGLSSNPTAVCFALMHERLVDYPDAKTGAHKCPNLRLLARDGAVQGTVARRWNHLPKPEHPLHDMAVITKMDESGVNPNCELALGDFDTFGRFLSRSLAYRQGEEGERNAT